ncbi:MFS transporter [Streptomyces sp. NPDC002690]
MQALAWTLVGLAYAVLPLLVWWRMARTPLVGTAVAVALAAVGGLLVAVQHLWLTVVPRPDAHLVFAVVAPLIVAAGVVWERSEEGPAPDQDSWTIRRNGAIGVLGTQFALTLVASLLYALVLTGASTPSASAIPVLPAGLTVESQSEGCGSSNCYRLLTIGSESGLSYQEIVRRLGITHEKCRPNGWLLDRRDLCIGLNPNRANQVEMYVTLSDLID